MEKNVCVFLGSREGNDPVFRKSVEAFAAALVRRDLGLVFGGSDVGLMKVLSETVLNLGGRAIGVFPDGVFARARPSRNLTELHRVSSMHERKACMAELSHMFVALPGGLGTLEEVFEAISWTQIGVHAKPCGFLNVSGYYDQVLGFLDHAVHSGFLDKPQRRLIHSAPHADELLALLIDRN